MDPGQDFFISYTGVNRSWAEWIAVQLERATYSTVLQSWDFRPGADFLHEMQRVTSTADRTIAVASAPDFGEAVWRAAFSKDHTGALRLLVPVRVQPCEPRPCWPAGCSSTWSMNTMRPPPDDCCWMGSTVAGNGPPPPIPRSEWVLNEKGLLNRAGLPSL